jgi:hypothetical protein
MPIIAANKNMDRIRRIEVSPHTRILRIFRSDTGKICPGVHYVMPRAVILPLVTAPRITRLRKGNNQYSEFYKAIFPAWELGSTLLSAWENP